MTRKQSRALFIAIGMAILALATGLMLFAMKESVSFFSTPTEIREKNILAGPRLRLGGLVEKGSLHRIGDTSYSFRVTDLKNALEVHYTGILPDLFREGQGVVAEGTLATDGTFLADNVLAKHDEKYMAPEVINALKKSGEWQGAAGKAKVEQTEGASQ
jgi:cytochrome c-type biogenesis protein CcmE